MDGREINVEVLSPLCVLIDIVLIAFSMCAFPIASRFRPLRNGFYCGDDTIRYPYRSSTVNPSNLYAYSYGIPLVIITALEVWAARGDESWRRQRASFLGRAVPAWLVQWLRRLLLYCYGLGSQEFLVHVGKVTVGRLRPHFLAVCQPDVSCNASGKDPHQYVLDYTCADEISFNALQARLSFPSGHAAMAIYAAVFTVLYMEKRMHWPERTMVIKTLVQTVIVALGWFTALSRIPDRKHHWGDVAVGSALGALVAWFWVYRVLRVRRDSLDVATAVGESQATYVFPMQPAIAEKP